MRRFAGLAVVVGMLGWGQVARAAPIIYNINRTIGAGTVTGTMTTDGTLGELTFNNFMDFTLTITDPNNAGLPPATFTDDLLQVEGSLTATPSQLLFDFSNPDGDFFFVQRAQDPSAWWCMIGNAICIPGGAPFSESIGFSPPAHQVLRQGVVAFGNVVNGSVPEPTTLLLLATGLAAVAYRRRRTPWTRE